MDAEHVFDAVVLGFILSPLYGAGDWLKWQSMKEGTVLPVGEIPKRWGGMLTHLLKLTCGLFLCFMFIATQNYWLLVSAGVMWFLGGWMGVLIERTLYKTPANLDALALSLSQTYRGGESPEAVEVSRRPIPGWWLKLMPRAWRGELDDRVEALIAKEAAGEKT